jgi:hypothetical protein
MDGENNPDNNVNPVPVINELVLHQNGMLCGSWREWEEIIIGESRSMMMAHMMGLDDLPIILDPFPDTPGVVEILCDAVSPFINKLAGQGFIL